jgi:hypothetical protein
MVNLEDEHAKYLHDQEEQHWVELVPLLEAARGANALVRTFVHHDSSARRGEDG